MAAMKPVTTRLKKQRTVVYLFPITYERLRKAAKRDGMSVSERAAKIIFDAFANVMEK